MVREMADAIPAAKYVEAEGASHAVHAEKGDWLVATVTGWLSGRLAAHR
jgi:pimeloyl-ACP methyl ester carboxylesterase